MRAELPLNGGITVKMIHAVNQLQAGGMLALQNLMTNMPELELKSVVNVHQTMETALGKYGDTENLPYGELVKGIVKYQSRPKRKKRSIFNL